MRQVNKLAVVTGTMILFFESPAYAYLDGASISLVLQGLTGAVAAVLLFGKSYLLKLRDLISRLSGSRSKEPRG